MAFRSAGLVLARSTSKPSVPLIATSSANFNGRLPLRVTCAQIVDAGKIWLKPHWMNTRLRGSVLSLGQKESKYFKRAVIGPARPRRNRASPSHSDISAPFAPSLVKRKIIVDEQMRLFVGFQIRRAGLGDVTVRVPFHIGDARIWTQRVVNALPRELPDLGTRKSRSSWLRLNSGSRCGWPMTQSGCCS